MNNLVTQPFYEIYKGETLITEKVERFDYETTCERDNQLSITIGLDFRFNPSKSDIFREGDTLNFRFGLLGERAKQSPLHVCRITDVSTKYADRVTLNIRALDKGNAMKKTKGLKAYEGGKLVKEIIKEIAERNELQAKIESGAGEFSAGAIVQGNRNDLAFCQYLCSLEPSGDYTIFVQDNELIYEKIGYDKKAKKTYYIFGDEKNVTGFESKYEESQSGVAMQNATTVIPAAKEMQVASITPKEDKTTSLGKNKTTASYLFDKNANEIGRNVLSPSEPIKQSAEPQTLKNETPKVSTAAAQRQKAGQKILKGSLTIELEPNIFPNEVITIAGGFEQDNGNWLVISCKHSGSFTTLQLTKNGTNRKGKGGVTAQNTNVVKAEKVNATIGESKQETKKILYNRNADKV